MTERVAMDVFFTLEENDKFDTKFAPSARNSTSTEVLFDILVMVYLTEIHWGLFLVIPLWPELPLLTRMTCVGMLIQFPASSLLATFSHAVFLACPRN